MTMTVMTVMTVMTQKGHAHKGHAPIIKVHDKKLSTRLAHVISPLRQICNLTQNIIRIFNP